MKQESYTTHENTKWVTSCIPRQPSYTTQTTKLETTEGRLMTFEPVLICHMLSLSLSLMLHNQKMSNVLLLLCSSQAGRMLATNQLRKLLIGLWYVLSRSLLVYVGFLFEVYQNQKTITAPIKVGLFFFNTI